MKNKNIKVFFSTSLNISCLLEDETIETLVAMVIPGLFNEKGTSQVAFWTNRSLNSLYLKIVSQILDILKASESILRRIFSTCMFQ